VGLFGEFALGEDFLFASRALVLIAQVHKSKKLASKSWWAVGDVKSKKNTCREF
jgi:hypothetical protein